MLTLSTTNIKGRFLENHSANDRICPPIDEAHLQAKMSGIRATTDLDVAARPIGPTSGKKCEQSIGQVRLALQ
ncbi:hypothetical protein [Burkholderia sp. Bp8963]|uniref:hypothetical protein n=1 Tax=Burkholderia sp. Bp8963 TaxID=2184547 RepID=UPI000F5943AC|nr:hypothetical protein [Burkholderia sp. Bp8963]